MMLFESALISKLLVANQALVWFQLFMNHGDVPLECTLGVEHGRALITRMMTEIFMDLFDMLAQISFSDKFLLALLTFEISRLFME